MRKKVSSLRGMGTAAVAGAMVGALAVGGAVAVAAQTSTPASVADHGGARRNTGDKTAQIKASLDNSKAKNVILLIGDGMGDSEITAARNYEYGAAGTLPGIDALPLTGQYTTYSVQKGTNKVDYVPDSAATGSAWATGTKTYDNAISVDTYGKPQASLLELAKAAGLKTGNVSTAEIQDATPAVQAAHISARSCYGPEKTTASCTSEALENGGLGSISEQYLATRADVTLGGGAKTFSEKAKAGEWKDKTLQEQAVDRGYQIVTNKNELAAISKADQTTPVLGLFASGNLETRWKPAIATAGGADSTVTPQRCEDNPSRDKETQPTLAEMTTKAIDLLDNDNGFFLQVEGASIDKKDHAADACGQIGETIDLDEAVQVALAFAKKQGNTTVIVTADHAHTSQIVDGAVPGLGIALETNEGSVMRMSYGTSPAGGSQQHTGSQLRVAGYGPGAANVVGLTDQTDLFYTIRDALGLQSTADPTAAPTFLTQPQSTQVAEGGTASFAASTNDAIGSIQWQIKRSSDKEFSSIVGGTGSYLSLPAVSATDDGAQIRAVVTNAKGSATSQIATLSVVKTNAGKIASSNQPVIAGTVRVGSTLTATAGSWNAAGVATTYQWMRAGKPIAGAIRSTYAVSKSDIGTALSVKVTAAKAGYAPGTANSLATVTVPMLAVSISAKAKKGKLTVRVTGADGVKAAGSVAVTAGKISLASAKKLSQGKATISLKALRKGKKAKITVRYFGSATYGAATKKATVKR
ncbi:alkaline phosphatase [Rarobacter incanus]|uniref:Alkaline phosphatase n=1 Tax=Rarobacter incanus TaxID=153494 RepID=A0A542SL89_9MICO|nr:alkaline phosphatase [Rarobacter incanus]TQK75401.1 alkaline phosphatase [Rarobacter incanus]